MNIQDIVKRKSEFIGRTLSVTVGLTNEKLKDVIIRDIELWENAIMITFLNDPGGELVIPQEIILGIMPSSHGFSISASTYSCECI